MRWNPFAPANRTAALLALSLILNCIFTTLTTYKYVVMNVRLDILEKELRIIRVNTDIGILCSADGLHWYEARGDGLCYMEDSPPVNLGHAPAAPTTFAVHRSTQ